ncbi:MAG: VTC domain-containing protein [Myxococcota bacterium]
MRPAEDPLATAAALAVQGELEPPPAAQPRVELKLPLANRTPAAVLGAIRRHPLGFERLHATRWIHNVYFDTPSLCCFQTSVAGASQRLKLRLRWYGAAAGEGVGALEWKWRRGGAGAKWVVPVRWEGELAKQPWSVLRRGFRCELDGRQRATFDALAIPTLLNRYRREYWISRDGRVRLTLDDSLVFVPQSGGLALQTRGALPWHRVQVLEVKLPTGEAGTAREALRGFPYRPARFSKYTTGIELALVRRA